MTLDELRKHLVAAGFEVSIRDDVKDVATAYLLDMKVTTLANWRSQRKGPPWIRLPCGIRYPLIGIWRWLDERTQQAA